MNAAQRKKWYGLACLKAKKQEQERERHSDLPILYTPYLCSLCRYYWSEKTYCWDYGTYEYDDGCNHSLPSVHERQFEFAREGGSDCWGFRPAKPFADASKELGVTVEQAGWAVEELARDEENWQAAYKEKVGYDPF